jgi:hypothetical protein
MDAIYNLIIDKVIASPGIPFEVQHKVIDIILEVANIFKGVE